MTNSNKNQPTYLKKAVEWFLRLALAAGFLSAVADRFGLWGPPGSANVAWGNWQHFLNYVAVLNGYAPAWFVPILGFIATIAEVVIAIGLLAGWRLHWFAAAAGVLLLLFALAMTFSTDIKTAFDASVYTASAGAFVLAAIAGDDVWASTKFENV